MQKSILTCLFIFHKVQNLHRCKQRKGYRIQLYIARIVDLRFTA